MATVEGANEVGRVTVEIGLANNQDVQLAARGAMPADQVRQLRVPAIVDTGATHLVLPESIANQLGVPLSGEVSVRYADQRTAKRRTADQVQAELLGRTGTFRAIIEPDRDIALIGAIVLEDLDLLVDCTRQAVVPRDPERYTAVIE
jgi:predicted aspartyl protease